MNNGGISLNSGQLQNDVFYLLASFCYQQFFFLPEHELFLDLFTPTKKLHGSWSGRKQLFCASTSPVTLSALINACCTETILQLFSLRSSCCPSDAAHAASSGQQLLLRDTKEKSFRKSFRRAADVIWRAENPTGLVEAQKSYILAIQVILKVTHIQKN